MPVKNIKSVAARRKLKPHRVPYWHDRDEEGLQIGLYRGARGAAWKARQYMGEGKHLSTTLDGIANLPQDEQFPAAWTAARKWRKSLAGSTPPTEIDVPDKMPEPNPGTLWESCVIYAADLTARKDKGHGRDPGAGPLARLNKHLPQHLKDTRLSKLTTSALRTWHQSLVTTDDPERIRGQRENANKILSILKAALNLAWHEDRVSNRDVWGKVSPFKAVTARNPLLLTNAQIGRLLSACRGSLRDLVNAAILTGCRYQELAAIRVRDFDPDTRTVRITLSKTGDREMYLSDRASTFFSMRARSKLPEAHLLTKDDGSPWGRNHHHRDYKLACRKAKMPAGTNFISLRHFYISRAIQSGVPMQLVAENVGTSVRMIELTYGKFDADFRRSMMNQVAL